MTVNTNVRPVAVVLKAHQHHLEGRSLGPPPRVSDPGCLGEGLRICIFNKFLGDVRTLTALPGVRERRGSYHLTLCQAISSCEASSPCLDGAASQPRPSLTIWSLPEESVSEDLRGTADLCLLG